MLKDQELSKLKSLLEEQHSWPCEYQFKFIVPSESVKKVEDLFPNNTCENKSSQKGKYTSLTVDVHLDSADHVIAIYQKASTIKGLMSL
jgi:putative lipoic acid-binding regulatory protein